MKPEKIHLFLLLIMMFLLIPSVLLAQLNMTVNSLADDEYSYAYDDPSTPEDESMDGICQDELGRCTIRAAIDESNLMAQSLFLTFSVNGAINLTDILYPEDGSTIWADNTIEMSGLNCFELNNDCQIEGVKFNNTFNAVSIVGNDNTIGPDNLFLNGYIGLSIDSDSNFVGANMFGIDSNNVLGANQTGIMVLGSNNTLTTNTICGNQSGILLSEGSGNVIRENLIGTNITGDIGLGNSIGIDIAGSGSNLIGGESALDGNIISGNSVAGISISGVPPDNYSVGNYFWFNIIGLDYIEGHPVPNGNGIVITNGARVEYFGQNIIAGNTQSGVHIFGYDNETLSYGHIFAENLIGVNYVGAKIPNGMNGITIQGNVEDVTIGTDLSGQHLPNTIVGNQNSGISVSSEFGFNPSKILFRKNLIYQNDNSNVFVSPQSNNGLLPPYSLSFNNNTIAGIHDIPGALIDIYKANINEFSPSAYEWLGFTTVGSNGVFSYEITDPSIEAVSLTATISTGNTSAFGYLELITGVEKEDTNIPAEFSLKQNFPNPFNPTTTIKFSIPDEEFVSLKVFNSLGEEVAELINETKPEGNYSVSFDASSHSGEVRNLTSGVYFYKISAGNFVETRKMILVK